MIGVGDMVDTLLPSMRWLSRNANFNTMALTSTSRFIFTVAWRKARSLGQSHGMHWRVLVADTVFAENRFERMGELKARVANEIKTTFASHITDELTLSEAIDPANKALLAEKHRQKYLPAAKGL